MALNNDNFYSAAPQVLRLHQPRPGVRGPLDGAVAQRVLTQPAAVGQDAGAGEGGAAVPGRQDRSHNAQSNFISLFSFDQQGKTFKFQVTVEPSEEPKPNQRDRPQALHLQVNEHSFVLLSNNIFVTNLVSSGVPNPGCELPQLRDGVQG